MPARVVAHPTKLRLYLNGPHGQVARVLGAHAVRVTNQAKRNATGGAVVGANNPEGRGPNVDTGRLRGSIAWELDESRGTLVARVGTNVEYAPDLELGLRGGGRRYPFLKPALQAVRPL